MNEPIENLVEIVRASQAIAAAAEATQQALDDNGLVYLPSDFTAHDLEDLLPLRRRARGKFDTPFVGAFAGYTASHAQQGATVFVDATAMTATAVLDLGTPDYPGHAQQLARLTPIKTAAFAALLQLDGRNKTQQQLAEFIEDWGDLAGMKFFRDSDEIPKAKAVAAIRRITIESARKVETEEQQLSAARTAFESVAATSTEPLPTLVYFSAKPYADLAERLFVLRLAILTGDKAPALVLRVQNMETHTEAMGQELSHLVREAISETVWHGTDATDSQPIPVLLGSYTRGA